MLKDYQPDVVRAAYLRPGKLRAAQRCMPIFFAVNAYRDCGKGYGLGMDPVGRLPSAGLLLFISPTRCCAIIPEGDPRRRSDHGGGYETSMMLHLVTDRVNLRANDGQADPSGRRAPRKGWSAARCRCWGLVAATAERMRRLDLQRDP
jgi:hypothetical protein